MDKLLVIASHKESEGWIAQWASKTGIPYAIYNTRDRNSKNFVEDIGREEGVYLQYIINNYHNLPDIIIFIQANPFEHTKKFYEDIENIDELLDKGNGFYGLGKSLSIWSNGIVPDKGPVFPGLNLAEYYKKIFGGKSNCPINLECNCSGIFAVRRENIITNPIGVYKNMLQIRLDEPEKYGKPGIAIELLWKEILRKVGKLSNARYVLMANRRKSNLWKKLVDSVRRVFIR